jgi:hypothetical protein
MKSLKIVLIGLILITSINCKKNDGSRIMSSAGTEELLLGEWLLDGIENQGSPQTLELCEYLTSLTFKNDDSYRYKIYTGDTDCETNMLFNFTGIFSVKPGVIYDEILELQGTDNAFAFDIAIINETELVLSLGISEEVFTFIKN